MGKTHTVALVGLETLKNEDGSLKKFSVTFYNNVITWRADHPKEDVVIVDARDFYKEDHPIEAIMKRLKEVSCERPIDTLLYSGHSCSTTLYYFSKVRKELEERERYFTMGQSWDGVLFSQEATIRLFGCQTGGERGKKFEVCIAQDIANQTRRRVFGFVSKSSQKKIGKKFYQVPDIGGSVVFKPAEVV